MEFGQRLADLQAWELGEATHVPAHLGPVGLETVDTLIMAGIADDRADAIRLVLPRFRKQPKYQQLRDRVREIDRLEPSSSFCRLHHLYTESADRSAASCLATLSVMVKACAAALP